MTSPLLMRGVTDVRLAIENYLAGAMPGKIALGRQHWGIDSEHWLPVPLRYNAYDPLSTNIYPTVGSLVMRSRGFGRSDYNSVLEADYNVVYSAKVFLWIKTPEDFNTGKYVDQPYDATLKVRDDMIAVLRSTLLDDLSLGTTRSAGVKLTLNESSMTEDYFDAIQQNNQTAIWYAGGSISVDIEATESQYVVPLGTADTISTNVTHL